MLDVVEDEPIHNELEENDSAYTFKNECSNSICKIYIKTKTGQEHVLLYPER
ncbi:hypothetical protein D3C71_2097220 [compost metagenome]